MLQPPVRNSSNTNLTSLISFASRLLVSRSPQKWDTSYVTGDIIPRPPLETIIFRDASCKFANAVPHGTRESSIYIHYHFHAWPGTVSYFTRNPYGALLAALSTAVELIIATDLLARENNCAIKYVRIPAETLRVRYFCRLNEGKKNEPVNCCLHRDFQMEFYS